MQAENQNLHGSINQPPIEPPFTTERPRKLPLVVIVAIILAFLIPPIGLVVSIIAYFTIRSKNLYGRGGAIFGIVWGLVFLLPWIYFVIFANSVLQIFIVFNRPNQAQKAAQAFISDIKSHGGQLICDFGDNGNGIDNKNPWFIAYYKIKNDIRLLDYLKYFAAKEGYQPATYPYISTPTSEEESLYADNTSTGVYAWTKGNGTLTFKIYRNTKIKLNCGSDSDNKEVATEEGAILEIRNSLLDTSLDR